MATNEKSSKRLARLASEVLRDKRSGAKAKALAGSVLTQAPNRKPPKKTR